MNVKVGDWIRFYQEGRIVTGVVQYVSEATGQYGDQVSTDIGSVLSDYILEVRPRTTPSEAGEGG